MSSLQKLLLSSQQKLLKALKHLEYSYNKIQTLSVDVNELDEESLETWESFAARFARVSEIFLTRFLRAYVLTTDPGFEGTLRDFINQGEKLNIIDNAHAWLGIRELRNLTAHDYSEEDLTHFFNRLKMETPRLLKLKEIVRAINV